MLWDGTLWQAGLFSTIYKKPDVCGTDRDIPKHALGSQDSVWSGRGLLKMTPFPIIALDFWLTSLKNKAFVTWVYYSVISSFLQWQETARWNLGGLWLRIIWSNGLRTGGTVCFKFLWLNRFLSGLSIFSPPMTLSELYLFRRLFSLPQCSSSRDVTPDVISLALDNYCEPGGGTPLPLLTSLHCVLSQRNFFQDSKLFF